MMSISWLLDLPELGGPLEITGEGGQSSRIEGDRFTDWNP